MSERLRINDLAMLMESIKNRADGDCASIKGRLIAIGQGIGEKKRTYYSNKEWKQKTPFFLARC